MNRILSIKNIGSILFLLLLALCLQQILQAQFVIKNDFLLNDDTTGTRARHDRPSVAVTNSGKVIVVWMDDRRSAFDIYLQMYSSLGSPLGKNIKVNDDAFRANHSFPKVVVDDKGFISVAWFDERNGYKNVYFQKFDSSGEFLGKNIQVSNINSGSRYFMGLSCDPNGKCVVAWEDYQLDTSAIYFQRIDSIGNLIGNNVIVVKSLKAIGYPSVSVALNDEIAIAWHEIGKVDYDIFLSRYSKDGLPIGSTIMLNDGPSKKNQQYPNIVYSKSGSLIAVWQDSRNDSIYNADIYCQILDSNGIRFKNNFRINTDSIKSYQSNPKVSCDANGKANISWSDYRSGLNIYFQRVNQNGELIGNNQKINDNLVVNNDFSDISSNNSGLISVVWQGEIPGHLYYSDIYLQKLFFNGNASGNRIKVNDDIASVDQTDLSLSINSNGTAVASWQDERDTVSHIYMQRFSAIDGVIGKNIMVNDTISFQNASSVVITNTEKVINVWEDYRNNHSDIFLQRFDQQSIRQGNNCKVNSNTIPRYQFEPNIAADDIGNSYVVWQDDRSPNVNLYLQSYDSSGNKNGGTIMINDSVITYRYMPTIAVSKNGTLIVVWGDYRKENSDVYAQWFRHDGTRIGNNVRVTNGPTTVHYAYPAVAIDSLGRSVVAWKDYRSDYYYFDIYIQQFEGPNSTLGQNIKLNEESCFREEIEPSVAMSREGKIIVVWHQYSSGLLGNGIIGQKLYPDGTLWGKNFHVVDLERRYGVLNPVVSANSNSIVYAWMDNRRSKGWDIYTKFSTWDWSGVTSVSTNENSKISSFELSQNYPNPFNPATTISYQLPTNSFTTLKVYDVLGREVAQLVNDVKNAGKYSIQWNASQFSSGVYFVTMSAGNYFATKKIVLMK